VNKILPVEPIDREIVIVLLDFDSLVIMWLTESSIEDIKNPRMQVPLLLLLLLLLLLFLLLLLLLLLHDTTLYWCMPSETQCRFFLLRKLLSLQTAAAVGCFLKQ
jgi:hypothetical protein